MKTVRVAAGIIRERGEGDRVLAVRRGRGELAGLWEFPGGKIERGETPAEACRRELAEELHVRIDDLRDFYTVEYDYESFHLSMECFLCSIASGEPELTEQLELRWVARRSLATLTWMPANTGLIDALAAPVDEEALVRRRAAIRNTMRANKRANTRPELLVRQRLRAARLTGYRLQWGKAPGRPDIAFPGRRIAIFVNGCFWHRCPRCEPRAPKRNVEFWQAKFNRNIERDAKAIAELERLDWLTITIWECELKPDRIDETMAATIERILRWTSPATGDAANTDRLRLPKTHTSMKSR